MADLKKIVANNIQELRKSSGLTQLQLAEKLNYSDKAVSKWESGASIPDVGVLLSIANLFGVTVDYLLSEDHKIPVKAMVKETMIVRKHFVITLLSVALVWLIATAAFAILSIFIGLSHTWLAFVYAVPVSSIVAIVFNSIWGARRLNYGIISILMWSVLASIYLSVLMFASHNIWLIFLIGIPGQVIICLWAGMKKPIKERV